MDKITRLPVRDERRLLELAVSSMNHGLAMFDRAGHLLLRNERFLEIYGLAPGSMPPGTPLADIVRACFGHLDQADLADLVQEYSTETESSVRTLPSGQIVAASCRPTGGGWVSIHEDITERKRHEARMERLAHHDALTDLWNRTAFNEHIAKACMGMPSEPVAVLCIDLDRFKEINDSFGHAVGDELLMKVARRLKAAARGAFIARMGGDEFTAVMTGGRQPQDAEALAERLLESVRNDIEVSGHKLRIRMSVGVAVGPYDGKDYNTLLSNADAALYRAKREGRDSIRFFEPQMDRQLRDKRILQQELDGALERGEFELHYQPQAKIDGTIVGFEALLRWHHPVRGMVSPSVFIPAAEESGVIMQIGEWALRTACAEAATWANPLAVGVNLSSVQFKHGDLAATVQTVLFETGLQAKRLELEITEGVLIDDFDRATAVLRRLKNLGVRIAMDDFGTGYSSLSYLQSFPFDKIKIDRGFVSGVQDKSQSATIVRAVINLSHALELPVLAEGVESTRDRDFLAEIHCDQIQGHLIGVPAPIEVYGKVVGRKVVEITSAPRRRAVA